MPRLFLLSLVVVGVATAADEFDYSVPADIADAARQFPKYAKMTEAPKSIGVTFAALCGSGPDTTLVKKMGPHYGFYVQHYRNDVALGCSSGAWPTGSILVKEKLVKGLPDAKVGELRRAGLA